jgi:hypothetical protein
VYLARYEDSPVGAFEEVRAAAAAAAAAAAVHQQKMLYILYGANQH